MASPCGAHQQLLGQALVFERVGGVPVLALAIKVGARMHVACVWVMVEVVVAGGWWWSEKIKLKHWGKKGGGEFERTNELSSVARQVESQKSSSSYFSYLLFVYMLKRC